MPIPTGISGSRSAAILGLSKYATPFTVWQDLQEQRNGKGWNEAQGYLYEPFEGNAATQFGHAFETAICELTEAQTGHEITEREATYSDDFITCHIDGIINNGLYEGKSANFRAYQGDWGEPGTDRIPTAYQCQIQHNLALTGLDHATMSVLVFPATVQEWESQGWQAHYDTINGVHFLKNHETDQIVMPSEWAKVFAQIGNFHVYHIEAKPDTHKILRELYEEFWGKYVVPCVAPEAADYSDIRSMFTDPKGVLVIDDKMRIAGISAADALREYKDCGIQLGKKSINSIRREQLKVQILKFAKDQTTVMDEEAVERVVFRDQSGNKLGQYSKRGFRS